MDDIAPQFEHQEASSPRPATTLRELEERARAALTAQRGQMSLLEDQIAKQLEAIASAIAEERAAEADGLQKADEVRAEAERQRKEIDATRMAWQLEKAEQEVELATLRADLEAQLATQQELAAQLSQRESELGARQAALDEKLAELAKRESAAEGTKRGLDADWEATRNALERERDELTQKFELALQDVQRFRGRTAELEQELARRPEASQADSAELVALRAERDALAERVEQLERRPPAPESADTEQEISDLRRRFEMAVEDVRELKTKNAQLEAKLAAGSKRGAPPAADSGGMDWESQKRRLLATLAESSDDDDDPLPEKDRITVENTIEMTDAVVAEKDREIDRLKVELANAGNTVAQAEKQDEQINELLDADEVIAAHRQRIAKLEREMEDKLRTAELELSVERAKIARQRAKLEELKSDLDSRPQSQGSGGSGGGGADGVPRRRWLSKLGLSGEE